MRANSASHFALIAAALLTPAAVAAAQCTPGGPPNPPLVRGALTGIVMDSAHTTLEGAEVIVTNPARKTRTDANGRFVLDKLEPGTYEVSVRRIGYEMAVQDYQVADSGGIARFCLVFDATHLAPMITSAKRVGLTGVIGDSTYQPLPGAEVQVLAQGHAITDTAGGFFIPLKPGTYAVTVSKPGYGRQLLSVTVPKDSGRNIAVWLASPPRNPNRMAVAYDDMRTRLLWANANRSGLASAEALARTSVDLRFHTQMMMKARLPTVCNVIVDGGPFTLPIDAVDKDEVATLEVYLDKPPRSAPTSINSAGTGSARSAAGGNGGGCGAFHIYVWMK